jgi:hypothetical protein
VDPWPPALHGSQWSPPGDRLPVRTQPYAGSGPADLPPLAGPGLRPRGARQLGTVLLDAGMLDALVDAVAALDVDVLAVVASNMPHPLADTRANVRFTGFAPMAHLLAAGVSVVVAADGAGTVLAPSATASRWCCGRHPAATIAAAVWVGV